MQETRRCHKAEEIGWLAYDAGNDSLAHEHFLHALRLVKVVGNRALGASVIASMSHLAYQTQQPANAVRLARAGRDRLRHGVRQPALDARLFAMEARGHAALGDSPGCRQALDQAERALTRAASAEPVAWSGHFDEGSLAGEAAASLRQLGELDEAERQARQVIRLRSADQARSRAFGQLLLAAVQVDRGELEAACAFGHAALSTARTVGSARVTKGLLDLRSQLSPHADTQVVRDFLAALTNAGPPAGHPHRTPAR
jgi:hypothetical protein